MVIEKIIKRRIKKLSSVFPEMDEKQLERELIPLPGEEVRPKMIKKKKI